MQQEVGKGFVAQVGYTGSEGHHLFDKYTVNLINPVTGKVALPAFGSFGLKANDGNNNFNALQATVRRRFLHGLLFQANYMWSHGIADASDGSGTGIAFQNMAAAPATAAAPTSMSATTLPPTASGNCLSDTASSYLTSGLASQILGGWSLSGLATARTGKPINITISRKAAALPDGNTSGQRPNLVPGVVDLRRIRRASPTSGSTRRRSPLPRMEPGATWDATSPTARAITKSTPACRSVSA